MSPPTDPAADPQVIPHVPRRRRKGRTAAAVIVTAVVTAAGALLAGWWLVVNGIESEVDAFTQRLGQDGGRVTVAERKRAGFPFHPTLRLTKPEIVFPPGAPGPWSWSGDTAAVSVSLFAPKTIVIALSGAGRLQATPFGRPLDLTVEAGKATARLAREPGRETATIDVANLSIATPNGETTQVDSAMLTLTRAVVPPADERTQAYSAEFLLRNLTLPETRATPLGRRMSRLQIDGAVLGPLAPAFDTQAFQAWRDAGGTIEITHFLARFGPLTISGEATVALDGDMQTMGAGTGRIQGFAPALDALAASQTIRPNDANAAKSFLTLLARPPMPGAEPQFTAPLTIQEKTLFVGPVAVLPMPQIRWPGLAAAAPPPEREPPNRARATRDAAPHGDDDPIMPAPAPKVLMPEGR